ncbi:MAG: hypothetical protein A3D13_07305 [Planctomycetes bacterium RIFCSPHIGHO2_02_FULL_40_12]|nr:MAG: hypothetical protein A3D13_07305 [Planctomycetes bacterium RIFCSPHIGHO2_02_FULL_40_12]OHC03496.1 MAG: hypothetical protein A3H23_09040 [Planctomycetes bacterium RIFCSPLOWO2_12_FULL_40_19]
MSKKRYVYFIILSLLIFVGCQTTDISQVPYKKEYSKYVNEVALLYYTENPEMFVNIRNDDMFLSTLMAGPAIVPQILMQLAHQSAKKEDIRVFNDMIFDLNIGEILCEKLNTKLQLCSYFHVVPQEDITKNQNIWELLEKKDKDSKDYEKIGTELDVDTIFEIGIISYGIKDPGVFSDPYASLKIDVKMTTASEGTVIWRDIVEARIAIGTDTEGFLDLAYTVPEYLKEQMEEVADVVSEKCVEKLGFDTNYTYLLEEDYINKTKHKINIAEKLRELNILRHENFITNSDYDKTKLDLIEQAKSNNSAGPNPETKPNVTEKTNLSSIK